MRLGYPPLSRLLKGAQESATSATAAPAAFPFGRRPACIAPLHAPSWTSSRGSRMQRGAIGASQVRCCARFAYLALALEKRGRSAAARACMPLAASLAAAMAAWAVASAHATKALMRQTLARAVLALGGLALGTYFLYGGREAQRQIEKGAAAWLRLQWRARLRCCIAHPSSKRIAPLMELRLRWQAATRSRARPTPSRVRTRCCPAGWMRFIASMKTCVLPAHSHLATP
jgi:hypothetical protein